MTLRTLAPLAAPLLLLFLAAPSDAQTTYRYAGKIDGSAPCEGEVSFQDGEGGLQVTQTVRWGKRTLSYSGRGQRSGGRILAALAGRDGITDSLTPTQRPAPKHVFLTFDPTADGSHWKIRTSVDARVWLRGWGRERAVEPTNLTSDNLSHKLVEGVHFLKGNGDSREIQKNDVNQGQLGDCYFLAALAAIADTQPQRVRRQLRIVSPNESEVFIAKRWIPVSHKLASGNYGGLTYVKSDSVYRDGKRIYELWPALYEKALVLDGGGYTDVEGGMVWTGLKLMGYKTKTILPLVNTSSSMRRALNKALARKQPITIAFPPMIEKTSTGKETGIVGSHVYAITGSPDGRRFVLYNPWGSHHPKRNLSPSDMRKLLSIVTIGK
jgi:calpain family cysteine protease